MSKTLEYPFTAAKVRSLKLGHRVCVSGLIFTGRDKFHRYLFQGGKSPVNLADGAIFHAGPVMARKHGKWVVLSAGPTTSARMDSYMPRLIEQHKIRVIIGKGGMSDATRQACAKHGCVYLEAVGGAAVTVAQCVKDVCGVHLLAEFGEAEAVWALTVKGLRAVVAIDAMGRSLQKRVRQSSKRMLAKMLK